MDNFVYDDVVIVCDWVQTMYALDLSKWDIQDFERFTLMLQSNMVETLGQWMEDNT